MGVTEHLLTTHHAVVAVHNMFTSWKIIEIRESIGKPLCIRVLCSQLELDLFIIDDATKFGVNEEHATRLQTTLANNARRLNLEDTGL